MARHHWHQAENDNYFITSVFFFTKDNKYLPCGLLVSQARLTCRGESSQMPIQLSLLAYQEFFGGFNWAWSGLPRVPCQGCWQLLRRGWSAPIQTAVLFWLCISKAIQAFDRTLLLVSLACETSGSQDLEKVVTNDILTADHDLFLEHFPRPHKHHQLNTMSVSIHKSRVSK